VIWGGKMIDPAIGVKLVFILGFTNILGLLLVVSSCRCILGAFSDKLSKSKVYMAIYKYHCIYWWFFIASVLVHSIIAITFFGNPFG
jgi:hypothetical protein